MKEQREKPYIITTIKSNVILSKKDCITQLVDLGVKILRFNLARYLDDEYLDEILFSQKYITRHKLKNQIDIMLDLAIPGAKIRLGHFNRSNYLVEKGQILTFHSSEYSNDVNAFLPINFKNVGKLVKQHQQIPIGDHDVIIEVCKILDENSFQAVVLYNGDGRILPGKGINIGTAVNILKENREILESSLKIISAIKPELIAFSFVEKSRQLQELKTLIFERTHDYKPGIISKIESPQGIQHLEEIILESDRIMMGRGDLTLTAQTECLGIYQQHIIDTCKAHQKDVIIATNILESLYAKFVPSQAEILDLTQMVREQVDGIVLSGALCSCSHIDYIIRYAQKIISAARYSDLNFSGKSSR